MNEPSHLMIPYRTTSIGSQQRPQVFVEAEATVEQAT
jgi:hypothetical protein